MEFSKREICFVNLIACSIKGKTQVAGSLTAKAYVLHPYSHF